VRHSITIADPADPRIAAYRDIREADLVGRGGRFIAEGEVVLHTCIRDGRHPLESVLIDAKRLDGLIGMLEGLATDVPIYAASQAVLDAVVGFHIHRGILALGRRATASDPDDLLAAMGSRALVVAAFGIGNHDNMGGIFRNAAAFGADAVLLGDDCCDPFYRKAIRVSVGAVLTMPCARLPAGAAAVAMLERHGFTPVALTPSGETRLSEFKRPDRAALLLGAEGPGLPAEMLARARTVAIPMAGAFDSLNVATTSGIALYQLVFGT
jgi:tRNA G18 (ribose-2'-O)-methylase SpoU